MHEHLLGGTEQAGGMLKDSPSHRKSSSAASEMDWWQFVDRTLAQAIDNYRDEGLLKENQKGVKQPIFIDLIIKLEICRAFVSNVLQKPLTAHRYLKSAENKIITIREFMPRNDDSDEDEAPFLHQASSLMFEALANDEADKKHSSYRRAMPKTSALFIMNDKEQMRGDCTAAGRTSLAPGSRNSLHENFREGSFAIPIDILEQKVLLHRGLVLLSQGEYEMAKDIFVRCINTGNLYDPRI